MRVSFLGIRLLIGSVSLGPVYLQTEQTAYSALRAHNKVSYLHHSYTRLVVKISNPQINNYLNFPIPVSDETPAPRLTLRVKFSVSLSSGFEDSVIFHQFFDFYRSSFLFSDSSSAPWGWWRELCH